MKKAMTALTVLLAVVAAWAQSPEGMSYQAVVRNAGGQILAEQPVGMRVSILQGSAEGTVVYSEIYNPNPQTNVNGLVSIEIGSGLPLTGTFEDIPWEDGPFFIRTETDPTGGTNYTIAGTSQLLSVPYALHSKTAEGLTEPLVETDPVFGASVSYDITAGLISNWNAAFGWGNHSLAGYANATHTHLASDIASGIFDIARIPTGTTGTTVALGNHLHGDYALLSHNHSADQITSGIFGIARGGTNTASIGAAGSVAFSTGSAYSFTPAGTANQILVSGGSGAPAWTSTPTVTKINYSSPRTHYATVGEAAFRPRMGGPLVNFGMANGGAYMAASANTYGLAAQVPMPTNVVITQIDIGYYDSDPNNKLNFYVWGHYILGSNGYSVVGSAETSTSAGSGYVSITGLSYTLLNNYELQILVVAETNAGATINWPGSNLKVTGAKVHYRITEAF